MKRISRSGALLGLLLAGCSVQAGDDGAKASDDALGIAGAGGVTAIGITPADPLFYAHALGNMCLDFGGQAYWAVGSPVTLYWCNGTVAQQIGVHEIAGAGHDVTLRVGASFCIGAHGGHPVAGAGLELQTCNGSDAQEFALDGDSIIAGHRPGILVEASPVTAGGIAGIGGIGLPTAPIARELVVKPLSDVTAIKTPVVLAPRALTENEYIRFRAVDGSNRAPHSGFVRPTDGASLVSVVANATWGTVVELSDDVFAVTTGGTAIPSGVTLRGYRKLTDNGPQITFADNSTSLSIFTIAANDVRVTGLRMQGPSDSTEADRNVSGITIADGFRVTVDHVELSDFTQAAISVQGPHSEKETACPSDPAALPRPTPVRIVRNFLHHNEANDAGYGVASSYGAFPLVEGNTEYMNRHSITSDYRGYTGYLAEDNLITHNSPSYFLWGVHEYQDFDVHGSDNPWWDSALYDGGFAGDFVQIRYNTFLAGDKTNVRIRGQSCRMGILDGNVFTQPQGALVDDGLGFPVWVPAAISTLNTDANDVEYPVNFDITSNNAFNVENPTDHLAVGDFDGDGIDDVFLGTGVGWYYSSGGHAEWRHLRRATEQAQDLRFGDLDGDGRADVIAVHRPGTLDVSWGGVSEWQPLTTTPAAVPIANFAIGNFDGDRLHGDDVFMTTGSAWFIAPSGKSWHAAQTSSFPGPSLRFGDFDHDGKTDVFGIDGGRWSISSDAQGSWSALGGPQTSDTNGLVVGDFDGDGVADVGRQDGDDFQVSLGGRAPFTTVRSTDSSVVLSGRFEGGVRADVLWWKSDHFYGGPGLTAPSVLWSRQDMR